MDATVVLKDVRERDGKNGTIYTLVDGNGQEFLTKNKTLAEKARAAGTKQLKLTYTIFPGNQRDDGSRWPDSNWIDKDGVTVVEAPPPRAAGGGAMTTEDKERATRLSAASSAATYLAGGNDLEKLLLTAEVIEEFGWGRLTSAQFGARIRQARAQAGIPEPDDEPQGYVSDDDIPF